MDTIEFIKERNRMCDFYKCCKIEGCPAENLSCGSLEEIAIQGFKLIGDVEQWSREHPQKTMLQDFLEKFPNAILGETTKLPNFCPIHLGYEKSNSNVCDKYTCFECWNRPLED